MRKVTPAEILDLTAYERIRDEFVARTLGPEAQERYRIIIDDPVAVARLALDGLGAVRDYRRRHGDAYYFNWRLRIDREFQMPFVATHESMAALDIRSSLPRHELAANLRRAFSGIVSGNVRTDTARNIEERGPFSIKASPEIMALLDELLSSFVSQGRMKIEADDYVPCYKVTG